MFLARGTQLLRPMQPKQLSGLDLPLRTAADAQQVPRASSPRRRVLVHRGTANTGANGAFSLCVRREEFASDSKHIGLFISSLTASIAEPASIAAPSVRDGANCRAARPAAQDGRESDESPG